MPLLAAALTRFDNAKHGRQAPILAVFHARHVVRRDLTQTSTSSVLIWILSALPERSRHRVELPQTCAYWVRECNRLIHCIRIKLNPAFEPNKVFARKTTNPRIIIARAIITEARFSVVVSSGILERISDAPS